MAHRTRERIITGARSLLADGEMPTVGRIAAAAGVSRTSFYRAFDSREELLQELEVKPEPGTSERILESAAEMVGAAGMSGLSMDDLAVHAGVSRATLYRIFPGKPALFTSLIRTYSPMEPVTNLVIAMRDERPEVVMPEIARTIFRTVYGSGAPRIGLLRAIFLELSSLSPDAEEAAHDLLSATLGSVGSYVVTQMAMGRLRAMHPLLALQSLIGPIFFHLLTRPLAERFLGLDVEGEQALVVLADNWLRAMRPDEKGESDG
jgi:AcrR family transcriptional regulator